jgi:hypothetical protein
MLNIVEDQQGIGDHVTGVKEVEIEGMEIRKPLKRTNQVIIRIANGSSGESGQGIVGHGPVVGKEIFEDVQRVPRLSCSKDFAVFENFNGVPFASKNVGRV